MVGEQQTEDALGKGICEAKELHSDRHAPRSRDPSTPQASLVGSPAALRMTIE
jgi:hypothetical protein